MKRRTWLAGLAMAGVMAAGLSVRSQAKDGEGRERSRAFLGVVLSGDPSREAGVRVDGIVDDSAADRARMEEGDVIVSFDGQPVDDLSDLGERLRSASPEDRVHIEVLRDGRRQTLDVTLDARPSDPWGRPRLGVQLVETTPELREHLGGDLDHGALVGKVIAGTPPEKAGLACGDLILTVDGRSVRNAVNVMAALRDKDGQTLDLEVVRDHRTLHLQATLP